MKKIVFYALFAVLSQLMVTTVAAKDEENSKSLAPQPYTATFALSYKGKGQSKPLVNFENLGDNRYRYSLSARGEKGMARVSGAKNKDSSEFLWVDGKPQPVVFKREHKYTGKSESWQADFDWNKMEVAIKHDKESLKIDLQEDTQDPVTTAFALIHALASGQKEFSIPLYSKEKISVKHYRVSGRENLQTALGCMPTIKVERVYTQANKYQKFWLAPEFGNIVVHSDADKEGKRRVVMDLKELEYAGKPVTLADRCR